jgi:phage shock protein PspC (stress-responsive transcriptional regulator)
VTVRLKTLWQARVAHAAVGAVGGVVGGVWGYYCGWPGVLITVVYAYFLGAVGGQLIARRWPQRLEVTP